MDHCFQTPDKTDHWCYCYYSVFKLSLKEKVKNCLSYTVTGKSIELHEDSLLWYHGGNCWLFGLPPAVWSLKKIAIYLLWSAAEWVMAECMCVHHKRCEEVKLCGWVCKKKKGLKCMWGIFSLALKAVSVCVCKETVYFMFFTLFFWWVFNLCRCVRTSFYSCVGEQQKSFITVRWARRR